MINTNSNFSAFRKFADRFDKNSDTKLSTQNEIDELEKEFKIYLPDDYKIFIQTCGDVWTPDILTIVVEKELDIYDVQEFWNIEKIIDDKKNWWTSKLSLDVLPFASDCMGNIFAFLSADLKKHRETADVYFYDHDFDTIDKIANSFTEWVENFNTI